MAAGKNRAFMVLPAMRSIVRRRAFRAPHREGLVTQVAWRPSRRAAPAPAHMRSGPSERSCRNNELKRDGHSFQRHRSLQRAGRRPCAVKAFFRHHDAVTLPDFIQLRSSAPALYTTLGLSGCGKQSLVEL